MGQTTVGILYGLRVPEGVETRADDYESGLLDRYEHEFRACPSEPWHPTTRLMGEWVAAGASGRSGAADTDTPVALDDLATTEPYATALRGAQDRWQAFALWAQAQGVALPPARLWLCETEVA